MSRFGAIARRLKATFSPERPDSELGEELQTHLEMLVEQNLRRGLAPAEARRQAQQQLGGFDQIKESAKDQRGLPALESLLADARFAARMFRKSPGFAAVAVLTLALGIGANTAIFSVINAAFLKPLPFPNAGQIVMVWEDVHLPSYQNDENTPAPGNFADWKQRSTLFSSMAAIGYRSWNLTGSGEPVRIEGEAFSSEIFDVLQTYPILGRTFTLAEDRPGARSHVALLGYGLWASRFGADPSAVGSKILLDGDGYTVLGIMPPGFRFPDPDDQLYVPLALSDEQLANHGSHFLRVVARLKPGATVAQAQSDLSVIARRLTIEHPDSNTGVGVRVKPLRDLIVGGMRQPLFVLFGVVALILLMVCSNVANLLFAHSSAREREFAVRSALGATRARLTRQLLVESLLLAVLGGSLGLALALWGAYALRAFGDINRAFNQTAFDTNVCLFTLVISLLAGVVFGVAPAFRSSHGAAEALKEGARGSSAQGHARARSLLIVAEVAIGVVVLIGTGLLLRSFIRLQSVPLGFDSENVLTFRVVLRGPRYDTLAQRTQFYQEVFERISAISGVRAAAGISFLPLTFRGRTTGFSIEGRPPVALGQEPFADFRCVSPGYFATMRTQLLQGRDFSWDDTQSAVPVAIISQTMARTFWPDGNALGKRFKLGDFSEKVPWLTVVGIVADVRQLSLTSQPRPAFYLAVSQEVGNGDILRDFAVRASGDPAALVPAIRSAIWSLDPTLPVSRIQPMEHIRTSYLGPQRFELSLIALFGALGLVLAAVGLYGVTAYSVSQRMNEIGIRMALGAQQSDVLRLVVSHGARLALVGVAAGSVSALALTRLMKGLLYEVAPADPLTFAGVAVLLVAVALLACYVPARRAMRVDPMVALRHE